MPVIASQCDNILVPTKKILDDLEANKKSLLTDTNTYIDSLMTKELYFYKKCKKQ